MESQYLNYKPLCRDTWQDFEELFIKYHGVRGGCWCAAYLTFSSEFQKMSKDDRYDYHKKLCMDGLAQGIIVYNADQPIGWCQFGSADVVRRFNRGRDYSKLQISIDDKPDYRISCVFVDKKYRKLGISKYALKAALNEISINGGGVVEVFPFDPEHIGTARMRFNGSVKFFTEMEFKKVAKLGTTTYLMRRYINKDERFL